MNAIDKLVILKTDLAVRNDNNHVGSGLGGNSEEFRKLLSLSNHIESIPNVPTISIKGDSIFFDEKYLAETEIKDIRAELSKVLVSYEGSVIRNERLDHVECIALATSLMGKAELRDQFLEELHKLKDKGFKSLLREYAQKEYFTTEPTEDELKRFVSLQDLKKNTKSEYNTKKWKIYDKFSKLEEASISHMEKDIWKKMAAFEPYILLSVVREIIGLDRLIKYSYDEFIDGPAEVLDKITFHSKVI